MRNFLGGKYEIVLRDPIISKHSFVNDGAVGIILLLYNIYFEIFNLKSTRSQIDY